MPESDRLPLTVLLTRLAVIAGVLLLAAGAAVALYLTRGELQSVPGTSAQPRVVVFEPQPVPVRREFVGYGPAQAMRSADVPARVGATVVWVNPDIDEGVAVDAGTPLVRLDAEDFQRRLNAAQQTLAERRTQLQRLEAETTRLREQLEIDQKDVELTRNELERVRRLADRGSASRQDLDAAERQSLIARRQLALTREQLDALPARKQGLSATVAAAEAEVELAQLSLQRTRIAAPLSGVMQVFDVELGENVSPGARIARIVDLDRIEVPLRLPSSARGHIGEGDRVTLTAASNLQSSWEASIARVAPEDDAATRTFTVYVQVEQPGASEQFGGGETARLLTPGLFLTGTARARQQQQRWVVPRRSLREGRVLLVEAGVVRSLDVSEDFSVRQHYPQLNLPDDEFAVLDQPLPEGSVVVVNASASVSDGQAVQPVVLDPSTPPDTSPVAGRETGGGA